MESRTKALWAKQNQHEGDRQRLFAAVATAIDATEVLYPGSFVDVAASMAFPSVTYVDLDRRARQFFADGDGVQEIVAAATGDQTGRAITFHQGDYRDELGLALDGFDLLISLYAGFVSEHCTRHLQPGGWLLVNSSHGDAAMASIDTRYLLEAVVTSSDGEGYRVVSDDLDTYLVPKKPQTVTVESLHQLGRGIAYTRSPFAYLFRRVQ